MTTYHPDADTLLDERYERIDSGRECPVCWKRIESFWVTSNLGLRFWSCPHCKIKWLTGDWK